MLVDQLTSVVLETTNPDIDDGLSKKERILGISKRSLLKGNSYNYREPVAGIPNVFHSITEEELLIPLASLEEVEGSFNFGKKVEYPSFKCIEQMQECLGGSEMDLSALENLFPGDNNFVDSLILGVYFHSIIQMNNLSQPYDIVRLTEKKFNIKLKFKVTNYYVKVKKVYGIPNDQYYFDMEGLTHDSFVIKVAIKHFHSRSSDRAQSKRISNNSNTDGEVSDLELVNVGMEEVER